MSIPAALERLPADGWLLFATRFLRLFAYGSLSVILVFYLVGLGLTTAQTGVLLTSTLIGDTLISLYLTTRADRIGRRRDHLSDLDALLLHLKGVVIELNFSIQFRAGPRAIAKSVRSHVAIGRQPGCRRVGGARSLDAPVFFFGRRRDRFIRFKELGAVIDKQDS